jgi:hypothetical protein
MDFRDNLRDRFSDARYFSQAILRNQSADWLGEKCKTLGCLQIGFRSVRIATIEHRPSAKLVEDTRYVGRFQVSHSCQ